MHSSQLHYSIPVVRLVALLIIVSGYREAQVGCEAHCARAGCVQGVRVAFLNWSSQLHFESVAFQASCMTQLVTSVALLIIVSGYCEAGAGCEARCDQAVNGRVAVMERS